MVEEEKIECNNKNERIIELGEKFNTEENILDINNNNFNQSAKCKNFSNEKNNINKNRCSFCDKNIKNWSKIIFCPCYCLFYKSFEWIWDGRCRFETYYKSFSFYENIFFCFISIIDIIAILCYKDNLSISFFIIRIISDSFGILIFWLSIVLWDEESTDKDYFETGLLFFTFLGLIIMGILDFSSFIVFCCSNSEFQLFVLMSFLIHLILSISIFSFNLCKFLY